jgi:hypothetical protein
MARDLTVDEIMAILPETPRRISEMTTGLTPGQLHTAPEVDAWSVNDVLAHLRACHDVLGGSVLRILAEDHPTWKGMSPRAWIKKTDYREWDFAPAFEAFTTQRAGLLAVIEPLPPDAWERTATVTGMVGETYERSARYFADWMAGHERVHWKHIARIVAAVKTADIPDTSRQGSHGRVGA